MKKIMKNSIYFCSHFQCFFFFAWRSSCCRLVFYLFSMSFLLFISVLNNSPESSKRRDLYIFCFQQQSQQFLLWECVYNVHTLEWNVCNNHQGAYIHSNKISLFSLMCLFSFYSNVEYFCVPFKERGSYLFWAVEIYIFCRSQAQRILMIPYYYYFFYLKLFFPLLFFMKIEQRTH